MIRASVTQDVGQKEKGKPQVCPLSNTVSYSRSRPHLGLETSEDLLTTQIDYGTPVLRFADAWAGRNEQIMEAATFDGDASAIHAFPNHFVLDRLRPCHRQLQVVFVGTDRIGVASHLDFNEAVGLRRSDRF